MRIELAPSARQQFFSAIRYIRTEKPSASAAFNRKADGTLSRLIDYPESCHPVPEFPDSDCRQVIVKSYRFFYQVRGDVIWVFGVWHGAQLPET